jgi:protein-disulfide isomerase
MDLPDSVTRRRAVLGGLGTLLTGGAVVYGASTLDSNQQSSETASFHASTETTGLGIDLAGNPIMGSQDAPLDMYYWSEYQCPFCRQFEQNAFPKLIRNQIKSGTVRVVFIEFPYLGDASMTAAVMDRCVWRTVRDERSRAYWRWHSTLFDKQGAENGGWASKENLLDITGNVDGVDPNAVESCMSLHRGDIEASINADIDKASKFGIRGTPAFILYNREADAAGKLVGAQPYDRFEEAITRAKNA